MRFARRLSIAAVCTFALFVGASAAHAQNTKLLPNDTEMIMTINLQQILKSEVVKSNAAIIDLAKGKINEGLEDKGVDKWFKKAGFDVFKDLSSITFAIPNGRNPEEGFILIEGNFDAEKIETAATEAIKEAGGSALKVIKLGGIKAFEVTPKEEKTMYVGILNKKTIIACATKADFIEAAARANGNKSAKFKSATFKSLVETVNAKQSISFVATSEMMTKLAEKRPEGAGGAQAEQALAVLKQMDGFSAALTIEKNIDFQLGVNTKDAETATKYAGLGTILLGAAKLKVEEAAKQNEKLQPAVDVVKSIRVSSQGANLMIRGQVTFETLDKVIKGLPIPNN